MRFGKRGFGAAFSVVVLSRCVQDLTLEGLGSIKTQTFQCSGKGSFCKELKIGLSYMLSGVPEYLG